MEYPFICVYTIISTGIGSLMYIFGGSDLSIFCRKIESTRPMREEKHGKAVHFPPESAFSFSGQYD